MQFLDNALELHTFTLKQCLKFPKRYTFVISNGLIELSRECFRNAKAGNSIVPTNKHEVQMRRDYFLKANACVMNMYTELDIAINTITGIEEKTIIKWVGMMHKEERLLKGIMKYDKERFKNFK